MPHIGTRSRLRGRSAVLGYAGAALALSFICLLLLAPSSAWAVSVTTPYPALTVQAGQSVNLDLLVSDSVSRRVDLALRGIPAGWEGDITGGGYPVTAVMVDPDEPSRLSLKLEIPADAAESSYTIEVVATSGDGSATLPITLTVSKVAGTATSLEAEYSSLKGPASATFTFQLTLRNESQQPRTYNLSAVGPENWKLSLKPAGASQETPTVTVEGQGSQRLNLEVSPGPDVTIGAYDLLVTASGAGEEVGAPLQVEITGTYTLSLTTPDGRLNFDVKAGTTTRVPLVIANSGTGPLLEVKLSASAPSGWKVSFDPAVVDVLPPNQQETVYGVFTPAEDAIAGDYVVSVSARADQASTQEQLRVTVKTSTLWGVVGVIIAVAAVVILGLIFRRFGHR